MKKMLELKNKIVKLKAKPNNNNRELNGRLIRRS